MTFVRSPLLVGIVLALLTGGCATQADIQEIEREQVRMRRQLADTRVSLEAIQRDIAKVRGSVDETRYSTRTQGSVASRLDALDMRVATLENARTRVLTAEPTASATTGAELGATPVPTPTPARVATEVGAGDLEREEARDVPDEYRKGLTLFRQRAYDRSIQVFRDFLRTNGESPLAPNAQYWIGESYFALGDYSQAILNFNDVRQKHPRSERAPAAILKIGLAFLQMGNKNEARLAFQKVVRDYPSSPEAAQAKEKLQALGG